jgi:arabinofuranosyltransferase
MTETGEGMDNTQMRKTILSVLGVIFAVVLVKTAWVSDDSYITLRVVDNLVHGYGLVWNVGERVQAFTAPLWLLVFSVVYAITREDYFTFISFMMVISIAAFILVGLKISKNWIAVSCGLLILILSKAYTDYSTSGMENPLSHLLLAIFAWVYFAIEERTLKRLFILGLIASLAALNRLDTLLLYLPILIFETIQIRKIKALCFLVLSFVPVIGWEVFSVIYYGFFLPNTAYAKLSTGVPLFLYLKQGVTYFLNSVVVDPITLLTIGTVLVLIFLSRNNRWRLFGIGIVLYLLYIIYIGGDFMTGRFFSLPLLASVILLIQYLDSMPKEVVFASMGFVAVFYLANLILFPYTKLPLFDQNGIADERLNYFSTTGLVYYNRIYSYPSMMWAKSGKDLRVSGVKYYVTGSIGFLGYFAGPKVYIVDQNALADPLLARLPITDKVGWRIGHFTRDLPQGYLETITSGTNVISDPSLAKYYDKLLIITRGRIWSWDRFITIWKMNTGQYNFWLPAG